RGRRAARILCGSLRGRKRSAGPGRDAPRLLPARHRTPRRGVLAGLGHSRAPGRDERCAGARGRGDGRDRLDRGRADDPGRRSARRPGHVHLASGFRYHEPVLDGRLLIVPTSQSGETADTLAALRQAHEGGARAVAICNVVGSSLAREADGVLYTRAGLEIGVASTKAFTAQLVAVTLLALKLGLARNFADPALVRQVIKGLAELPDLLAVVLQRSHAIRRIAERFADRDHFLYLGRGLNYPLALEGALKLKEISYIHAEGYPAGEMKHGPIALIDQRMPVVAIAPRGATYEKMTSNLEEVKARDGVVIAVATEDDEGIATKADVVIPVPSSLEWLQPILLSVTLQLLAYHM